jgi:hypothetical protein
MYTSASGLLKCMFQAIRVSGNNTMYTSASCLLKCMFQAKRVSGNVYVCLWFIEVHVPSQESEW